MEVSGAVGVKNEWKSERQTHNNVQKLINQKIKKIVLVMKSGVKIVLKTIKNHEKSLKIVFLDVFDVLMWLIFEIL